MRLKLPKDKHMATVKVGEKGQIVIPKEIRDMFKIEPGDILLLLADEKRGIAIVEYDGLAQVAGDLLRANHPSEEDNA